MFNPCYKYLILTGLLFCSITSLGQFYNGLQMSFGKSRIQYGEFYWSYYRFERFDTYFNEYGKDLALYTEWFADEELKRLESMLDYTLERRIVFVIYNKLTDFRQSNIGLVTGSEDYNTGGVTRIFNNKVSLYYEGDHVKFQKQISAAIAQVMLTEMLYGEQLEEPITNSIFPGMPEWFSNGLISFLSENWSPEIEDFVKDGILSGRFKNVNKLTDKDALYAGHSFWRYIQKTYGKNVISNIIYLAQVNRKIKDGFLYVLGTDLKSLKRDWYSYYSNLYHPYAGLDATEGLPVNKHSKKDWVYNTLKLSPDGKYIAYTTNKMGQYKLWLYNTETRRKRCLLKKEQKIVQIPDYSFPVLAWHPDKKILSFITEEKGGLKLYFYNAETKERFVRNLLYFEKVLDFSYSGDGSRMVMSAVQNGKTDIYVHNIAAATDEQITNDLADDITPRFVEDSKKIIFSSNRKSDSLFSTNGQITELSPNFQLYMVSYPVKGSQLIQLTHSAYANHTEPLEINQNKFIYLGDDNGIINRYFAKYDSTISYIDTAIHYRYYTTTYPITNYKRNILQHDFSRKNNKVGQIFFRNKKYYLYQNEILNKALEEKPRNTAYREEIIKTLARKIAADSSKKSKEIKVYNELVPVLQSEALDSGKIKVSDYKVDVNHYVFELEKGLDSKNASASGSRFYKNAEGDIVDENENKQMRIYLPAFYINSLVNQVDFSFLNATYQPFNNSGSYFNPGFNLNFMLGANDLFDDYKITGGVRFGIDFESNEYMLSFEDLKKRLDKQFVYHRIAYKTVTDDGYDYVKIITQEGYYILRYPFNQVFSVRGTSSLRYDRTSYLALERASLDKKDIYNFWAGVKGELIFDNSRKLNINIYSGTRAKVFAEAYKQINLGKSDLFVLGFDYRHYLVLHRNLILANRIAGSTSFGGSRLIYYLGSVDNWINFSTTTSTFDNTIPVDDNGKYAFQALATNMRGFTQNIRNGNNFMVINSEIRWPFITYFSRTPLSSNFWNSLQAIGFLDIGSAWTGWNPYSGNNAYDYNEISYPSSSSPTLTIHLNSNRSPIVYGFGYGLRAQLIGYFVRFDWAYGIDDHTILSRIFYLSLSLDF
jgi:WD40 repeat protein